MLMHERKKQIRKWPARIAKAVLLLATLAALALLWGFAIEPSLLTVTNIEFADERLPSELDGMRVVFFADLHVGSVYPETESERVARKITALKPDLVLFGGDLTQWEEPGKEPDSQRVAAAFAAIEATYGKYAVLGNHDVWPEGMRDEALGMLEGSGFTVLENQAVEITPGFWLTGTKPFTLHRQGNTEAKGGVARPALDGQFTLLLAHEPAQVDDWVEYPFALQLSGHTHNGQVALPFLGPLAKTYGTNGYYAGKYQVRDTLLYVTRGVGVIDKHVRFGAPPEIVVVTLRKSPLSPSGDIPPS